MKVLEKDFDKTRVDFSKIGPYLAKGFEPFLRSYYYNCMPYQSAAPAEQERGVFSRAEKFYHSLRKLDSFEIRMGRLEFRGVSKESGKPIFEQKRVDVQLAVDLLTLSYSSGQIATAVLVAGDSDFIPAVEASKREGVQIVVCSGTSNPAHRDLVAATDRRVFLSNEFINYVRLSN